jgi:uncharacterized membrane protein
MKAKYLVNIILCVCFFSFMASYAAIAPVGADTAHAAAVSNAANAPAVDMWNFPNFHPLVVHFPIVLLLFAALLQFLSFWRKDLNLAVIILLVCGTAGAWLAAEIFDAHPVKTISLEAKHIFQIHHQFADYTTWLSTAALVLKSFTFFLKKQKKLLEVLTFVVLTAAAVTVSVSGHYGSALVHIEGIGPKGNLLKGE